MAIRLYAKTSSDANLLTVINLAFGMHITEEELSAYRFLDAVRPDYDDHEAGYAHYKQMQKTPAFAALGSFEAFGFGNINIATHRIIEKLNMDGYVGDVSGSDIMRFLEAMNINVMIGPYVEYLYWC